MKCPQCGKKNQGLNPFFMKCENCNVWIEAKSNVPISAELKVICACLPLVLGGLVALFYDNIILAVSLLCVAGVAFISFNISIRQKTTFKVLTESEEQIQTKIRRANFRWRMTLWGSLAFWILLFAFALLYLEKHYNLSAL